MSVPGPGYSPVMVTLGLTSFSIPSPKSVFSSIARVSTLTRWHTCDVSAAFDSGRFCYLQRIVAMCVHGLSIFHLFTNFWLRQLPFSVAILGTVERVPPH